tara:strand:- start:7118 stop:8008 length:891 start_codon:yes stop_codon:yes gene_type:complete
MTEKFQQIKNITILGVGLIGGSLGLALKENGFKGQITGLGRRIETLNIALERNVVDFATTDFKLGVETADLLIIGTPVSLIPQMVKRISEQIPNKKSLFVTDAGSVKTQVVREIDNFLNIQDYTHIHFVGSHPMAGSERTSVAAARADLFNSAKCIVTPSMHTSSIAIQVVKDLWEFVGGDTIVLSPTDHDYLVAGASHLPHLIASVLTQTTQSVQTESLRAIELAATGFRDTTRIAAGSPEIWRDVFLQNAEFLIPMVKSTIQTLEQLKILIKNKDSAKIEEFLAQAKKIRDTVK